MPSSGDFAAAREQWRAVTGPNAFHSAIPVVVICQAVRLDPVSGQEVKTPEAGCRRIWLRSVRRSWPEDGSDPLPGRRAGPGGLVEAG